MSPISNILFCDYVSQDTGGKFLAAGIYTGDIVVPEFPAKLFLALYGEVVPPTDGDHTFKLTFRLDDQDFAVVQGGIVGAVAGKPTALSLARMELGTAEPVTISLWGSLNDDEPQLLRQKAVILRPTTAS